MPDLLLFDGSNGLLMMLLLLLLFVVGRHARDDPTRNERSVKWAIYVRNVSNERRKERRDDVVEGG